MFKCYLHSTKLYGKLEIISKVLRLIIKYVMLDNNFLFLKINAAKLDLSGEAP